MSESVQMFFSWFFVSDLCQAPQAKQVLEFVRYRLWMTSPSQSLVSIPRVGSLVLLALSRLHELFGLLG